MNLPYQNLIDISTAVETFLPMVMFLLLSESRLSKKAYYISTGIFLTVYMGFNLWLLAVYGLEVMGNYFFYTQTIPSCIFFFIVAKHRNGKFFFTFCLVDTVVLWVISVTGIVDVFFGNTGLVTVILRAILFPLLLWCTWYLARKPYLRIVNSVSRGWGLFAATTILFYLTIGIMVGQPTNLRYRPEDIPAVVMVLALLPIMYMTVFWLLAQQEELYMGRERNRQMKALRQDYEVLQKKLELGRNYRHDIRHHMTAVTALLRENDCQGALDYLEELQVGFAQSENERWCKNSVVNGVLSAYLAQAREAGCELDVTVNLPEELPVEEVDLCVALANALENAIHACAQLPTDRQRKIKLDLVLSDNRRLTLRVENPCLTSVDFDSEGFPIIPHKEGHGQGLRSISAVAEKYHGLFQCCCGEGVFTLQVVLLSAEGGKSGC